MGGSETGVDGLLAWQFRTMQTSASIILSAKYSNGISSDHDTALHFEVSSFGVLRYSVLTHVLADAHLTEVNSSHPNQELETGLENVESNLEESQTIHGQLQVIQVAWQNWATLLPFGF